MDLIETKFGYSDCDPLLLRYFPSIGANFGLGQPDERFEPARKLLCQILTDFKLSMTEDDFDDQMQYTEFALIVAESILPP